MGLLADGDLALLHRLEQRGLHLGRGAVDLVGEEDVAEDRAGLEAELALAALGIVDLGAGDVGGQQVRRELDAAEVGVEVLGHRLDGPGLGEAGQALDQQVAVGEQADQHALDHAGLAEDLGVHRGLEGEDGVAGGTALSEAGARAVRACTTPVSAALSGECRVCQRSVSHS